MTDAEGVQEFVSKDVEEFIGADFVDRGERVRVLDHLRGVAKSPGLAWTSPEMNRFATNTLPRSA